MKIKRYIISAVALTSVLMLPMLESCRTELCYNHFPAADISLFWEQEWERDYGMGHPAAWNKGYYGFDYDELRPSPAEWVAMVRYSKNGSVTNETYFTPQGGQLMLSSDYDDAFLLYNADTEYIVFSDMASLPDARATSTTRTRSSISYIMERHPGVRSMNPPDVIYSAYLDQLPNIRVHETAKVPVKLQPLVYTYLIRYEFESGVEHVALARGAIAGMAESVYLLTGHTSVDTAIILFDCEVKDYGCEVKVRSFGVPGFPDKYYGRTSDSASQSISTLNLEVMLTNGKTTEFNFDITDQLRNQPRGGVIRVGGIKIEEEEAKPDPIESGFDVDLSGWGDGEDIELPVDPDGDINWADKPAW